MGARFCKSKFRARIQRCEINLGGLAISMAMLRTMFRMKEVITPTNLDDLCFSIEVSIQTIPPNITQEESNESQ